jgi:outer membrane lipoprotein-sorting protein
MTTVPDSSDERPLNELPPAYRAAVEAVLAEPVPQIDLERLIHSRLSPPRPTRRFASFPALGTILMSPRNLLIVAAAIALIALVSQWIPSSNGDLALAQVQQQVEKLHTAQFTETFKQTGSPPTTTRKMTLGDSRGRWEGTAGGDLGRCITIMDEKQLLNIFPDKKGYVLSQYVQMPADGNNDSGKKGFMWRDTFGELLRAPVESVKRLPEKTIDGKTAVGFVTEREEKSDGFITTSRRTYWIDSKTKLPILVEFAAHSTNPDINDTEGLVSDFVFDAPLDPALFSTEPPKGYTDMQPKPTPPAGRTLPPGLTVPLGKTVPSAKFVPAPEKTTPGKTDR